LPPLPPIANTLKVSLGWQLDLNQTAESILHFQYSGGPPSAADCAAIAGAIQGSAVLDLKSLLQVENKVGIVTVLDIGSTTGAEGSGGTATAGTLAGAAMPASISVVMQHAIARRYRGGKPRSYAPFGDATKINSTGTWTSAFLALCVSGWASFITSALTATSGSTVLTQYGSVSYYTAKALRTTPHWDPILATTARTRIGSQRRRLKTA
jgi:hypothetical protein